MTALAPKWNAQLIFSYHYFIDESCGKIDKNSANKKKEPQTHKIWKKQLRIVHYYERVALIETLSFQ